MDPLYIDISALAFTMYLLRYLSFSLCMCYLCSFSYMLGVVESAFVSAVQNRYSVTASIGSTSIGAPSPDLRLPPTMSQISKSHTDNPNKSSALADHLRAIRRTSDLYALQCLHHDVTEELRSRSPTPVTHANSNSDLSEVTGRGLLRMLDEIFRQVTLIVSEIDDYRYVNRCLDRGQTIYLHLSSARYKVLTKELEPDEKKRIATYYDEEDDRDRERWEEYKSESEMLEHIDPPTVDDRDEEY